jgi:hypothetical protein
MAQRRRGFGRGAVCTMVDRASQWIEDVIDRTPSVRHVTGTTTRTQTQADLLR